MKHKHCDVLVAWLTDQSLELEHRKPGETEWHEYPAGYYTPLSHPDREWRIRPKMVRIGRHEWPMPLSVVPKKGTFYWVAAPNEVTASCWVDDELDFIRLSSAVIHLTKEAAQQHAGALMAISRGDL